jgi:hypothetical protein
LVQYNDPEVRASHIRAVSASDLVTLLRPLARQAQLCLRHGVRPRRKRIQR